MKPAPIPEPDGRHFWLYCDRCKWQTKRPDTAMKSICPECRKRSLGIIGFNADDWRRYAADLLSGALTVYELALTVRRFC